MKKTITALISCALALFAFAGCSATAPKGDSVPGDTITDASKSDYVPNDTAVERNEWDELSGKTIEEIIRDKNVKGQGSELLSLEELISFYLYGEKFPENFAFEELDGYGRILDSASSKEEACAIVNEHFTSGWCTTVESRLLVETEYFYGVYAKWAYRQNGTGEVVSYYDENVVCFKKAVYDAETKQFGTKDADIIKKILDYTYYYNVTLMSGFKVYRSDISIADGKYEYVTYLLRTVYGDWGIQDRVGLIRETLSVDMESGETSSVARESAGHFSIDGKCTNVIFMD